ncbi:MAG TPA: hypothetical protein VF263_19390 [Longimicrobiaceae bacterium]
MKGIRDTHGFAAIDVVFALLLAGIVLTAVWDLWRTIGDEQLSVWAESNRRGADLALERELGEALAAAGQGMRSSANLAGFHVVRATPSDTIYTMHASGTPMRVATRGCRPGTPGACIALLGDHRRDLARGMAVALGTHGTGMEVLLVSDAPSAFSAPCGADCIERILCDFAAAPAAAAPDVGGSQTVPPGGGPPLPSTEPCLQPVLADGSRCTETETTVAVSAPAPDRCVTSGPAATYTEVRLAEAGTAWGLPRAPVPPARRAGAGGTPAPLLQPVEVSRFWVRGSDSTLVRETEPTPAGSWASSRRVAAPVLSVQASTLQLGGDRWVPGLGFGEGFLEHAGPSISRAVGPADDAPRSWVLTSGYHTVAAVRVTYELLREGPNGTLVRDIGRLVERTPGIRAGASAEGAAP